MNSRRTKLIIIACLCVAVLGLSIGYALLSTRLNITGTAKVPASTWDVVFLTDEIQTTKTGMAKCDKGTIEGTSISGMSVEFTKPGDACTFSIPVKNTGNISAKLVDVTGKSSNLTFVGSGKTALSDQELLQKSVVYEVNYGNTQINGSTDFSNIDLLKADNEITVTLRVTFNHSAKDIPKNPVTLGGLDRGFIFESLSEEESGEQNGSSLDNIPNKPELNGDMIPVYYDKIDDTTGTWKKADVNNENNNWYDYSEQKWANAVTVVESKRNEILGAKVGTTIDMKNINTMWVWIPRYSYTIKSEDGTNYFGKASFDNKKPTQALPGEIDVKFVSKVTETGTAQYTGDTPTNWRTNEAFDFGGEKKNGIWVGKFETTGDLSSQNACINEACDVSKVTIIPGMASLRGQRVASFFYVARSMQLNNTSTYGFDATSGDLHMMKNDEWGAVAYLSQSKYGKYGNSDYSGANKEVYINNDSNFITGHSGGGPSVSNSATNWYEYNNMTNLGTGRGQAGPGASTTGNITGIYDMSGGSFEYVMGVLAYNEDDTPMSGESVAYNSGFTGRVYENSSYVDFKNDQPIPFPDSKYYNLYKIGTTIETMPTGDNLKNSVKACDGGVCYGQGLSETSGWYGQNVGFLMSIVPWSLRGGDCGVDYSYTTAGVFSSRGTYGNANGHGSFRLVFSV